MLQELQPRILRDGEGLGGHPWRTKGLAGKVVAEPQHRRCHRRDYCFPRAQAVSPLANLICSCVKFTGFSRCDAACHLVVSGLGFTHVITQVSEECERVHLSRASLGPLWREQAEGSGRHDGGRIRRPWLDSDSDWSLKLLAQVQHQILHWLN